MAYDLEETRYEEITENRKTTLDKVHEKDL